MKALLLTLLFAAIPTFPGATGFGTFTTAGSGRHLTPPATSLIRVTNLDDSGVGSLRACIEGTQSRTCVFEISGAIKLQTALDIKYPYLTIAGQTAPSPGITILGCGLKVNTHDVLIQHVAIRPGDNLNPTTGNCAPLVRDGMVLGETTSAYNVVIDHVSVSWSIDELMSTYKPTHDITLSHMLLADALRYSIHPEGGQHAMGPLFGNQTVNLTLQRSILADLVDRNPRIGGDGSSIEILNNFITNYGGGAGTNSNTVNLSDSATLPIKLTIRKNLFLPGIDTPKTTTKAVYAFTPINAGTRIFIEDTHAPAYDGVNEWSIVDTSKGLTSAFQATAVPFPSSNAVLMPVSDVPHYTLENVGSRPLDRSVDDELIINRIKRGMSRQIDCVGDIHPKTGQPCPMNAGGWPTPPVHIRALAIPPNFNDLQSDGYTTLEDWIYANFTTAVEPGNSIPIPPVPTPTAPGTTTTTSSTSSTLLSTTSTTSTVRTTTTTSTSTSSTTTTSQTTTTTVPGTVGCCFPSDPVILVVPNDLRSSILAKTGVAVTVRRGSCLCPQ